MEEKNEYLGGKYASEKLGVHQRTLYQWEKKGLIDTIRTPGGKRLYNVKKYINIHKKNEIEKIDEIDENDLEKLGKNDTRLNICYVRVSSHGHFPATRKHLLTRSRRGYQLYNRDNYTHPVV